MTASLSLAAPNDAPALVLVRDVDGEQRVNVALVAEVLTHATDLPDVFDIHAVVKAAEGCLKSRRASIVAMHDAAEAAVRCERRLGELLAGMPKAKPGPKKIGNPGEPISTLADLGIEKRESSLWRQLAALPLDVFDDAIFVLKGNGTAPTVKSVLGFAKPQPEAKKFNAAAEAMDLANHVRRVAKRWPADESSTPLLLCLRQLARDLTAERAETALREGAETANDPEFGETLDPFSVTAQIMVDHAVEEVWAAARLAATTEDEVKPCVADLIGDCACAWMSYMSDADRADFFRCCAERWPDVLIMCGATS